MGGDRTSRISEEIKRELASIILNELKDPRIPKMVSIVALNVTKDLRYAKVYISVYGSEEEKKNALEGLRSASGFLRKEIGGRIQLRYTPELVFELDNSIEHGAHISGILNKLKNDAEEKR